MGKKAKAFGRMPSDSEDELEEDVPDSDVSARTGGIAACGCCCAVAWAAQHCMGACMHRSVDECCACVQEDLLESDDDVEEEEEEEEGAGAGPGSQAKKKKKGSQRPEREPIYDVDAMHGELFSLWAITSCMLHAAARMLSNCLLFLPVPSSGLPAQFQLLVQPWPSITPSYVFQVPTAWLSCV